MPIYEIDVFYSTHELMRHGLIEAGRSRVEVLAADHLEAERTACWMVAGRSGFYVTRTDVVGWTLDNQPSGPVPFLA